MGSRWRQRIHRYEAFLLRSHVSVCMVTAILSLLSACLIISPINKVMRAVHLPDYFQDVSNLRAYIARFLICAGPNSLTWAVRECWQRQRDGAEHRYQHSHSCCFSRQLISVAVMLCRWPLSSIAKGALY